jgi:hypothetical protein
LGAEAEVDAMRWTGLAKFLFVAVTAPAAATQLPSNFAPPTRKHAQCVNGGTVLYTAADLNTIRQNLNGSYCLGANVDLSSVPTWTPIGDDTTPFDGSLDGLSCLDPVNLTGCASYVIANLTSSGSSAGLFGYIGSKGRVVRLGVVNANIGGDGISGSIAARNDGSILNAFGVAKVFGGSLAGGLVGLNLGSISQSFADAFVQGTGNGVGGLVASNSAGVIGQPVITNSFSMGRVVGGGPFYSVCCAGGLVGENSGLISQSSSVDAVTGSANAAGGLVGVNNGTIYDSYAAGRVDLYSYLGHFGGFSGANLQKIQNAFALGAVVNNGGTLTYAGFNGYNDPLESTITSSYWDLKTTQQNTSDGGQPIADNRLKRRLLAGFDSVAWQISPGESYPYLMAQNMWLPTVSSAKGHEIPARLVSFRSTLALMNTGAGLFAAFPIGQLQSWQYHHYDVDNASTACKATVYAMIARIIGEANPTLTVQYDDQISEPLRSAKIDYFMDSNGNAVWPLSNADLAEAVRFFAGSSRVRNPVDRNAAPFDREDIIEQLHGNRFVMVRGCTNSTCTKYMHWMMATALVNDQDGNVTGLIANDPETGQQVTINMNEHDDTYRQIIDPSDYPGLAGFNFTANWYYSVQFKK